MTAAAHLTKGSEVLALVKSGWELWHVATSPLPGRWELRHRSEPTKIVSWDAIEIVRRQYLDWFRDEAEEHQVGRYTWFYRAKQAALPLGRKS